MSKSKIGLVLLGLCCCYLIWLSIPKGIASLYKLGLENLIEKGNNNDINIISSLSNELMSLDSVDPDNLLDSANAVFLQAVNSENLSEKDRKRYYSEAKALAYEATKMRPLDFITYTQLARIEAYLGNNFTLAREALRNAQQIGPYEAYMATTSVELYLSYWSELTREEKLLTVRYITQHKKYGLTQYDINNLLEDSPFSSSLCNITAIKQQLGLSYCH